jgi:hypothetical protein
MLQHFLRAINKGGLVGVTEGTAPSGNSFTVDYPSGTQNGDLAFLALSAENNFADNFTSTGWTHLDRESGRGGIKSQLLYRVVSGTGTQTFTKGGITTGSKTFMLVVFRNFTYSSFAGTDGGSGTPNPPLRTGTFNAVVAFGHSEFGDSSVTPPTGYISLGEIDNGTITTMGAYIISSITDPNPDAFTNISSGDWIAYTIGLT